MKNETRTAIATINTEIGTMTIYFNGANEEVTAELNEVVEEIGCCPETIVEACDTVYAMYSSNPDWELDLFEGVADAE